MKLYKLTDEHDQTYGGCQWGPGVTVETSGKGGLCGPGFTHWYTHPLLAALLNPVHGRFNLDTAHLWEGEGEPVKTDYGLKVGCTKATTLRRVDLPKATTAQRVRFGILCAMAVYTSVEWRAWAEGWLSGADRSKEAAWAEAARAEGWLSGADRSKEAAWAEAARAAAAAWAAWAAWAAAAARAAEAAAAAEAAEAAARAAAAVAARVAAARAAAAKEAKEAAAWAAAGAARAAEAAADAAAKPGFDLIALAEGAMKEATDGQDDGNGH